MSRQLKLSAILSVLAMAGFAVAGVPHVSASAALELPRPGAEASAPTLPALGNLLPGLR